MNYRVSSSVCTRKTCKDANEGWIGIQNQTINLYISIHSYLNNLLPNSNWISNGIFIYHAT